MFACVVLCWLRLLLLFVIEGEDEAKKKYTDTLTHRNIYITRVAFPRDFYCEEEEEEEEEDQKGLGINSNY